MKTHFFEHLNLVMEEGQILRMTIAKSKDGFDVMATPHIGGKDHTLTMSGTWSEFEENFISELKKPIEVERKFRSNADSVSEVVEKDLTSAPKKKPDVDEKKAKPGKASPPKKIKAAKPEKPKEEKAELPTESPKEKTEVDEKARKMAAYNDKIAEAQNLAEAKEWSAAHAAYVEALTLKPGDKKAFEGMTTSRRWISALKNMKLAAEANEGGEDGL